MHRLEPLLAEELEVELSRCLDAVSLSKIRDALPVVVRRCRERLQTVPNDQATFHTAPPCASTTNDTLFSTSQQSDNPIDHSYERLLDSEEQSTSAAESAYGSKNEDYIGVRRFQRETKIRDSHPAGSTSKKISKRRPRPILFIYTVAVKPLPNNGTWSGKPCRSFCPSIRPVRCT